MSSSSFDFLEGWTSDDSHSLSASETELDISPDEALLLADLIASVADKPVSTTASSQHHQAVPDIEDHEYLRLALEETFLPDDDTISDQKHQRQTGKALSQSAQLVLTGLPKLTALCSPQPHTTRPTQRRRRKKQCR